MYYAHLTLSFDVYFVMIAQFLLRSVLNGIQCLQPKYWLSVLKRLIPILNGMLQLPTMVVGQAWYKDLIFQQSVP